MSIDQKVKIYTKTGCPYCAAAKEDFQKRGVDFEEVNLSEEPLKITEMVKLSGGRQVPVIVEGDNITVGFGGT
jgi:glutaredoxin